MIKSIINNYLCGLKPATLESGGHCYGQASYSIVVFLSAAAAMHVSASVPLGVYAVVDKVVLEPADAEPQRVQIWGTFALWDDRSGLGYRAPERDTCITAVRKSRSESAGTSGQI